ncbi:MAG TPA: hypothetical protein VFU43_19270 [Streptosporangiaceae bacterium]|nr:hypothetical protein [Streptosporangiaceae bacterium]
MAGNVLLCAGVLALAGGLGAFGAGVRAEPVLDGASSRLLAESRWLWPAVAVLGGAVALGGLIGLTGQVRTGLARHIRLGRIAPRLAVMVSRTNFVEEVERLPGVVAVRAKLTGTRPRPRLAVTITCAPRADIGLLRQEITAGPAPRVRVALGRAELCTVIHFQIAGPI